MNQRLPLATFSISSLFLRAYELWDVALLGVDDLVGQDFGNGLLGFNSAVTSSVGHEVDGLLTLLRGETSTACFLATPPDPNTGGVFSGTSLEDGSDEDLEGVLSGEEVDDLEGVPHNSAGFDFLSGVSAGELHGADESLDDGAESFS